MIRRREFITLLGGAAMAWPLAARAQSALGQGRQQGAGVEGCLAGDEPEPAQEVIDAALADDEAAARACDCLVVP